MDAKTKTPIAPGKSHYPRATPPGAKGTKLPLHGIIPPLVTPLLSRQELDMAGLERLVEHILGGGVHGLFILGTTGEAPSLSHRLRRELIERVCAQVGERVPVLVGITDTSVEEMLQMVGCAASAGAKAVVLAAPYYFPPSQTELLEYVERLLPEIALPLLLYNMPQMTKVAFEPETVHRLSCHEKIVGIKDSSGSLDYFDRFVALKRDRPDWSVLAGAEQLLVETLQRCGDGGVTGGANVHPKLLVEIYDAVKAGDLERAGLLQQQLLVLGKIYSVGRYPSAGIKGLKCALSLLGLCDDHTAEPIQKFLEPERERVRVILSEMGLLP